MRTLPWPDWLNDVWAKSAARGEGGRPEDLASHTWAVLQRLRTVAALRPQLPEQLNCPRLWHHLYWAAFMHDWGKAAQGFQARLRGGKLWPHRHEVLSLAFLNWLRFDQPEEDQTWVAAAIVSHHRDADDVQLLYSEPEQGEDDQLVDLVDSIPLDVVEGLWRWATVCAGPWLTDLGWDTLGVEPLEIIPEPQAIERFHKDGPKAIYSHLRRYRRFVRGLGQVGSEQETIGPILLRGHLIMADHIASAHVSELPPLLLDSPQILGSRGLTREQLYDHQIESWHARGHILLTAPTGTGKTEAALLWASNQIHHGQGTPRLFYTLPYQASMNAMADRLKNTLGDNRVGLQHGRALLALYRLLMEQDYTPDEAVRQAKRARDLMGLHTFPVRVFSPYQMLKGMYRLKGYEALLTDFQSGLFVFDEIHAYEPERLAMILKSVGYLARNLNARFIIMSATFPKLIRSVIDEELPSANEVRASTSLFDKLARHRLDLIDGEITDGRALAAIETDVRAGKSVLVCCNLVRRAQYVYRELQERLSRYECEVFLLHGGFNMRDRSRKEQRVRELGSRGQGTRRPFVLVATQVIEVSLDIDLDTLYTDPAPLEALVQRFGRINRRACLQELAPVHIYTRPSDGQYIYRPEELIHRSLELLARENGHPVNEGAVGDWLSEIYAGQLEAEWLTRYNKAASDFEEVCLRGLLPFKSADKTLESLFYQAFDGVDVIPKELETEYQQLFDEQPIRAQELVCSISYGRLCQLRNAARTWEPAIGPIPIEVPYTSEMGFDWEVLRAGDDGDTP